MVVKDYQSRAKSKRPDCKNYKVLVNHHLDPFIPLKMEFFKQITKILQHYLVEFQTEKPMVPFLGVALENQMRKLAKMVIKKDVLDEAKTQKQLMKIDFRSTNNHLALEKVSICTKTKQILTEITSPLAKK